MQVDDSDYEFVSKFYLLVAIDSKNGLPYAYGRFRMKGRRVRWAVHRMVMGVPPDHPQEVDHIEPKATLDNRKQNLRFASRSQNNANRRLFKNNTSGYRGVSRDKGKWAAILYKDSKRFMLGRFDDPAEAYEVYRKAKIEAFWEYARVE